MEELTDSRERASLGEERGRTDPTEEVTEGKDFDARCRTVHGDK